VRMFGHDRPHPTTSSGVELTMVARRRTLDGLVYTELRGRAPKGILEQIDPLEIILALERPSPNSNSV
jgi:hypothetical protein